MFHFHLSSTGLACTERAVLPPLLVPLVPWLLILPLPLLPPLPLPLPLPLALIALPHVDPTAPPRLLRGCGGE